MKKKILDSKITWIFVFILGLLILLYPTISDRWNKYVSSKLIVNYEQTVSNLNTVDLDQIYKDAVEYNEHLVGGKVPDAFAYEEANSPSAYYESLLNPMGNGLMGYVEVPVINVNLPLYHYTTEEVLEKGVGHLPGSSLPVGGKSTHTVLSAHRGLPSAKLFTDLDKIIEGDIFYLRVLDKVLAYEVDLIKVIEPTETEDLAIVQGQDYATLFTCTPYSVNTHRLLVRGHRIDYDQSQYDAETHKTARIYSNTLIIRIICILLGIELALAIVYVAKQIERRKEKKKKEEAKGVINE